MTNPVKAAILREVRRALLGLARAVELWANALEGSADPAPRE